MHQDDSVLDYVQNKKDSSGKMEYRLDNPIVPRNELEWELSELPLWLSGNESD